MSAINLFLSSITPVPCRYFDLSPSQAFNLCQRGFYGVSIILITKRLCTKNKPRGRADDGYLIAKLVLLMLFTLADALHIRLVNRVNLFLTMTPLCKNRLKSFNQLSVNRTRSKIALEFSD